MVCLHQQYENEDSSLKHQAKNCSNVFLYVDGQALACPKGN